MPTCGHGRKGPCQSCDAPTRKVIRPSARSLLNANNGGPPCLWEIPGSAALYYIPRGVLVPDNLPVPELKLPKTTYSARLYAWQAYPKDFLVEMKVFRDIDTMVTVGAPFWGAVERARVTLVVDATLIELVDPITPELNGS